MFRAARRRHEQHRGSVQHALKTRRLCSLRPTPNAVRFLINARGAPQQFKPPQQDLDMRKLILLLGVISLAACNNDSTSPNGNVTGTYTLRTVNGNPLPYTFSDGSVLVSDHLSLNNDGTYIDVATFSNAGSATEQGLWSINNNLITFNDQTDA